MLLLLVTQSTRKRGRTTGEQREEKAGRGGKSEKRKSASLSLSLSLSGAQQLNCDIMI